MVIHEIRNPNKPDRKTDAEIKFGTPDRNQKFKREHMTTLLDRILVNISEDSGTYTASVTIYGETYTAESNRDYAAVAAVMDIAKKEVIKRMAEK